MANPVLERRNDRARAAGWSSYAQQRRWVPRFDADQAGTALALGRRICPHHPALGSSRQGSYVCRRCNLLVNPYRTARVGDWRARLVNVAHQFRNGRRVRKPTGEPLT